MTSNPKWLFDEMKPSTVDYHDSERVQAYDNSHRRFRDYQKSAENIMSLLGLKPEHTVIDMGSGTGAFSLHAARHCKTIYAVDVSMAMLAYCHRKAEEADLQNIVFCHGGFLTYEHGGEQADAMVSVAALHHLPDFWKLVGLRRVAGMLRKGGRLFLFDVVFPSMVTAYEARFDDWVLSTAKKVGADFASELETHIREEYSTYDWIMERFLELAGFQIDRVESADVFGVGYACTKR